MTDTQTETETDEFSFTPISAFDEFTDRQLLQFLAARFNDICSVVVNVGNQAPEAFAKLSNPMVALAVKALIK